MYSFSDRVLVCLLYCFNGTLVEKGNIVRGVKLNS